MRKAKIEAAGNYQVYMIRNPEGLFSTGGQWPRFRKAGKVWSGMGPLKNHLRQFEYYGKIDSRYPYKDCEIVVFEQVISTKEGATQSCHALFEELHAGTLKKIADYEAKKKANLEAEERRKLEELKAKYE